MQTSNIWVTPTAKNMSQMLIDDLHINEGRGLASVLSIAPNFSNYEAVALWIQNKLTYNYNHYCDYEVLRFSFIGTIPSYMQGNIW